MNVKGYGRRAPRRTATNQVLCQLNDGTQISGRLLNVSASGIAAELERPIPNGAQVRLVIEAHSEKVFLDAKVVGVSGASRQIIHCEYLKGRGKIWPLSENDLMPEDHRESITSDSIFSLTLLLASPFNWITRIDETVRLKNEELLRDVRLQLIPPHGNINGSGIVMRDERTTHLFVALRPRKESLVKVFDVAFTGAENGRRLSHDEHITVGKLLILNGFMALCGPLIARRRKLYIRLRLLFEGSARYTSVHF